MSETISAFSIYRTEQRLNKSEPIISKKVKKTPKKPTVIPIKKNESKEQLVDRMIEQKKFDLSKKRKSKKEKVIRKKSKLNKSLNSFINPVEQSTPILKKQKTKPSNGVSSSFESDNSVIMLEENEENDTLHGSVVERNVIQKNTSESITEYNSVEVGKKLFEWVISPIKHELFFK